jgi:hypothetical protein
MEFILGITVGVILLAIAALPPHWAPLDAALISAGLVLVAMGIITWETF